MANELGIDTCAGGTTFKQVATTLRDEQQNARIQGEASGVVTRLGTGITYIIYSCIFNVIWNVLLLLLLLLFSWQL
jgi:hypothetical protein